MRNNNGTPPTAYLTINENFRYYTNQEKTITKEIKKYINDIIDFADTHNLTVSSIATGEHDPLTEKDMGRIGLTDNETGKNYFISDSAMRGLDKDIGIGLHNLITTMRDIPPTYEGYTLTDSVHLLYDDTHTYYGWYSEGRPDQIVINVDNLTGYAFKNSNDTGLKGTIFHEMAHLYDWNTNQSFGSDGIFGKSRSHQPAEYGDENINEVISTVIEQVGTGKLRIDAHMKDGTRVSKYARENGYDYKDPQILYQIWSNEWKPLTTRATKIINGEY